MSKAHVTRLVLALLLVSAAASAESPVPAILTLADAKRTALQSSPLLSADARNVDIAKEVLTENRAAYFPTLGLNLTAAGGRSYDGRAGADTTNLVPRVTAGSLNAPSVPDRAGAGVVVTQLLTDFGRTGHLVDASKATITAAQQAFTGSRQDVLLRVTELFYSSLAAKSSMEVAQKTLQERQTVLDQISLLQKNELKSQLDVEFADIGVERAKLLILDSQSREAGSLADLARTLGTRLSPDAIQLADSASVEPPPAEVAPLIARAADAKPQLQSLRASFNAASEYAKAQRALSYPTLSLVGAAGTTPVGNAQIAENYTAGGVNLSIPLFQGGRLDAQYHEALARARQIEDQLRDAELANEKDVRIAWLGARSAYEGIGVAGKLRDSARRSLELAESRYRLGLSSIVELNRAQLDSLDAEIGYVDMLYQYKIARARLDYQLGAL